MAVAAIPLRIRLRKGSTSKVAGFYSATRHRVCRRSVAYSCTAYLPAPALLIKVRLVRPQPAGPGCQPVSARGVGGR
jgi:hypothetical protein